MEVVHYTKLRKLKILQVLTVENIAYIENILFEHLFHLILRTPCNLIRQNRKEQLTPFPQSND